MAYSKINLNSMTPRSQVLYLEDLVSDLVDILEGNRTGLDEVEVIRQAKLALEDLA